MVTVSASFARESLHQVIETADHEAVIIADGTTPRAVAASPAQYERIIDALEEIEEFVAAASARAEAGAEIPGEDLKSELGLT